MCIREKHLFHNDISPHFKFLFSNESLDFCEFLNKRSKWLTMQIYFHSLLLIYKGTNNSDHVCIYSIYIYTGASQKIRISWKVHFFVTHFKKWNFHIFYINYM